MDDRTRYLWLKLLTILGPTLFVAVAELVRDYYLTPRFSPATVSGIAVCTTLVGAVIFSWYVFRAMERLETERRTYKEAVLSLKERERIAREMHDGIAQNLAVLKIEAYKLKDSAAQLESSAAMLEHLDLFEKLLNQTYLEVRQTLYDLRASRRLDEGFWPTIERQVREFERHTGVPVQLKPLEPREELWSDLASMQILRIIQEALANVRKHARARSVDLECVREGRTIEFMIRDDGLGFVPGTIGAEPDHYGLAVMKERAEAIGGYLMVDSQAGRGTTVTLRIPVEGRGSDGGKGKTHAGG
jgi:signal transduction histidine kinase